VATQASGELDGTRRAFEEAIALLDAGGAAYEVVRTRLDLAETLILMGHPEAADREAEVAREGASRLGAAADVARADQVLSGLRDPAAGFKDLTSREVEILRLLAAGKSNSEMAEDLFVSVRTVERHVSNIYAKIGVFGRSGRVAAAAYAHTHGIT
jgi:DNA-binding NarL/FixJ family response regulator